MPPSLTIFVLEPKVCPREYHSQAVVSFGSGTGVPPVNGHGQDGRATADDTTTDRPLLLEEVRAIILVGLRIENGNSHLIHARAPVDVFGPEQQHDEECYEASWWAFNS